MRESGNPYQGARFFRPWMITAGRLEGMSQGPPLHTHKPAPPEKPPTPPIQTHSVTYFGMCVCVPYIYKIYRGTHTTKYRYRLTAAERGRKIDMIPPPPGGRAGYMNRHRPGLDRPQLGTWPPIPRRSSTATAREGCSINPTPCSLDPGGHERPRNAPGINQDAPGREKTAAPCSLSFRHDETPSGQL